MVHGEDKTTVASLFQLYVLPHGRPVIFSSFNKITDYYY